ncbi:MAG: site-2 protease family protein, partial [Actinomycetota bacterium]|nr:site-2 protease family protein [Actinomycetota bacterium]
MKETLRLGEIAGVRVGVNWSVLVIFFLIALGLAAGRFPAESPGLSSAAYIAAGLVAAVVFLVSLLAHEIAHAVVARRSGVEVHGITLWLFGGVARLGGEAKDPAAELRIAGVGPLMSLVLAGVFAAIAGVAAAVDAPGIVVGTLRWLAVINVALAVFNLMPAAPLDGGRILRGFLWWRRGDRVSAAVTSARAGKVFGFLLVGLGLLGFVSTVSFGGLWLVLIGWFIISAASAEERHAQMRGALVDVDVGDVMTPEPVTVAPGLTVEEFLERYAFRYRHASFPLVDEAGRLAGLVTLNRVKDLPPTRRGTTHVSEIACPPAEVPTAEPDEPLAELLPRLNACADGRAIVVTDSRIVGIVS